MAKKYGFVAKIGADTSGLTDALQEVEKDSAAINSEIRKLNKELKFDPENTVLAAQKLELMGIAAEKAAEKVRLLKEQEEAMNAALEKGDISAIEYSQYQREIESAARAVKAYADEVEKANGDTKGLNSSTDKAENNFEDIAKDVDSAADAMENASEKSSRLSDVIKGGVISDVITDGLRNFASILKSAGEAFVNFAGEGIGLASDLEEVKNVVDTTFGADSNKIYEFADTAAEKFGLSKLSAEQYAGTLGAIFKSSGITQGIDEMSISMAGLAADMASFYNLDTEGAFSKLRAGIAGETEPLKQLGINMNTVNLEAYALANGIEKSWESMSLAEQTTLRYNYILSQTADAQGDFARTSENFANQQRVLNENISTLKSDMGEKLIPAAKEFLNMVNDNMPLIKEAADYIGDELADSIEKLSDKAEEFIESGGLERTTDALMWIIDNGDKIITVGTGIAAVISAKKITDSATAAGSFVKEIGNLVGLSGGVNTTATAITGAGAAATSAAVSFNAVAAAMIAAALAAEGIKDITVDEWQAELKAHEETLNTILDETLAINEEAKAFNNLTNAKSEFFNPTEARSKALDELDKYTERRKELVKQLEDTARLSSLNAGDSDYAKHLRQQVKALEAEIQAIDDIQRQKISIIYKWGDEEIRAYEESNRARESAMRNEGKTNSDIVSDIWENITERTKAELARLDEEYAKHNITREQYLQQGIKYLEEHRNEESVEWWEWYDSLTAELAEITEAEKKQYEKNKSEKVDAILDLSESVTNAVKQAKKEEIQEWEKSSKEITDSVTKAYEDVTSAFESARDEYISAGELIGDKITDTSGTERYILSDFEAKTKELQKYQKDLEKLKDTGISDELMEQIMKLSYDNGDRQAYIQELLRMGDRERKAYYADITAYYREAKNVAALEVSDELAEADKAAADGIKKIYGSLPDDVYAEGVKTAQSYLSGIEETMRDANAIRFMGADFAAAETQKAILQSTATTDVSAINRGISAAVAKISATPVTINIAGQQIIRATVGEMLRENLITGGNNTYV